MIADFEGYFGDPGVGFEQELAGGLDPAAVDIIRQGEAGGGAEEAGKMVRAEAGVGRNFLQGDAVAKVVADIMTGAFDSFRFLRRGR